MESLFWLGSVVVVISVIMLTAVCVDRSVSIEELERAVSKCPDNGGLKLYMFDLADATVTCNNGAVFYYKLGGEKQ